MMAWKSEELESLYESLKHKMFIGCEQEPWNGHGTVWDTIDVNDRSTEIIKILKEIYPKANGRVWKGFTGPKDSYDDYRLYAKIVNKSSPEGQYKITGVKTFPIPNNSDYRDKYGVIILINQPSHGGSVV